MATQEQEQGQDQTPEATSPETSTTPTPLESARAERDRVTAELKIAKTELKKAKRNLTAAEKKAKDAEGDDLEPAVQAAKEADAVATSAQQDVERLTAEVEQAKAEAKRLHEEDRKTKEEERASRPRKANLTLSQRRAMLKLGDGPVSPQTSFNALPYQYLVSVGLAQKNDVDTEEQYIDGKDDAGEAIVKTRTTTKVEYTLTETGAERVKDINPKWRDWRPAERVAAQQTESTTDGEAPAETDTSDQDIDLGENVVATDGDEDGGASDGADVASAEEAAPTV